MKSARMLSILMLLQVNERMTARQLADEMEVSVRTIYRDIEALSISGVPIYTDRGHGGGISLLEDYRSDLTGLTEDELQALFLLSVPSPLADLGLKDEFRSAFLKLASSLPESRRLEAEKFRERILLDEGSAEGSEEAAPFLNILYKALWDEKKVSVSLQMFQHIPVELILDPMGLISRTGEWYLAARVNENIRPYPVGRIRRVKIHEKGFSRPDDFNLEAFWREWSLNKPGVIDYRVKARIAPNLLPFLPGFFGRGIIDQIEAACPDEAGWRTLELRFNSFDSARARLLDFGGSVEIISPEPLRLTVLDYARQIIRRYAVSE